MGEEDPKLGSGLFCRGLWLPRQVGLGQAWQPMGNKAGRLERCLALSGASFRTPLQGGGLTAKSRGVGNNNAGSIVYTRISVSDVKELKSQHRSRFPDTARNNMNEHQSCDLTRSSIGSNSSILCIRLHHCSTIFKIPIMTHLVLSPVWQMAEKAPIAEPKPGGLNKVNPSSYATELHDSGLMSAVGLHRPLPIVCKNQRKALKLRHSYFLFICSGASAVFSSISRHEPQLMMCLAPSFPNTPGSCGLGLRSLPFFLLRNPNIPL
jgi:hypothetical protein